MENYRIKLKSLMKDSENEIIANGSMFKEFNDTVVLFNTNENGVETETKVVIGKEIVSIVKTGYSSMMLTFVLNESTVSRIETPYGGLVFNYFTKSMYSQIKEDSMLLLMEYEPSDYEKLEIGAVKIELKCEKLH